jgi:Kef-type K+ transport system membrane component KefB
MVSKLNTAEVLHFLLILSVMLVAARVFGEICRKLKQPSIAGEILAGILLGPSVLGSIFPGLFNNLFLAEPRAYGAFDGIANVGIILLMFIAGFEVDLKQIRDNGKQAASISLMGILFPFAIGFAAVWLFYDRVFATENGNQLLTALFFGTALSITALSVITKILIDLNLLKTKIGNLVVTSAMIDDFLGWILFSFILGMMNTGKEEGSFSSALLVLVYIVFMLTAGRWLLNKLLSVAQQHLKIGRVITLSICLCLLSGIVTEYLGIRAVFGAFLMGIAIGDSVYFTERHKLILHQFTVNIIAPLFFASIGLRLNFITDFNLEIVLIILAVAFIAKLIGAGLGAKLSGMSNNESLAVSFGMNARGAQEIVLGLLGVQAKLISEQVFVGLVIMTVLSVVISGPAMRYFFIKEQKRLGGNDFIPESKIGAF